MHPIAQAISKRGGLAATFELYESGFSRAQLSAAVARRSIVRVRQGWYATPHIHPTLIQAARVGGRVTCLSALALHGVWSPQSAELHVSVAANTCRLRTRTDMRRRLADVQEPLVRIHWTASGGNRLILDPIACLEDAIRCQKVEMVTALADSVLHQKPGLRAEWERLLDRCPTSARRHLQLVDGVCESGTESLTWFRMQPFRLPMRRQVRIAGVGEVDFLVGHRLVIEVDGATYHTDPEQFERDRHRDAVLSRLGYRVLRFSYLQVMFNWPEVEAAILGAVVRGDHF